ncbi:hypothetical protein RHSIM_Rhsim04G0127000 [Rhododendron simsii]|uniref:AN1-type domain-containing protein n=1 Tax=Rhododendron simsii TaxID=118357 RepID=A0A834H549_RHOSS|nr:hypothetical protein RHSIM_Rhsim04G0127000 [Rhododendron simsii]
MYQAIRSVPGSDRSGSDSDPDAKIAPPPPTPTRRRQQTTAERREVNRCSGCWQKVWLTRFSCRCGDLFCSEHRYSDPHNCSYDYKAAGREAIERENLVLPARGGRWKHCKIVNFTLRIFNRRPEVVAGKTLHCTLQDLFWKPLPHNEVLAAGESYNLLPLNSKGICGRQIAQVGHVRSNSLPQSQAAPYRMSFDGQGILKRSYTEAFSRYNGGGGIWKVNYVCRGGVRWHSVGACGAAYTEIIGVCTVHTPTAEMAVYRRRGGGGYRPEEEAVMGVGHGGAERWKMGWYRGDQKVKMVWKKKNNK